MAALMPYVRGPRSGPGTPPPAAPEGCEDGGQRYVEDTSEAKLSDTYPAGLATIPVSESLHSSGSEARGGSGKRGRIGTDVPVAGLAHGRRDVSLDVRLTGSEREAIRDRARVLGVKPSAWGRAVMLDALDARRRRVEQLETLAGTRPPGPGLGSAVEQLRRVGVNLNQVLRRGTAVDDGVLREVLDAVTALRASLGDRTSL